MYILASCRRSLQFLFFERVILKILELLKWATYGTRLNESTIRMFIHIVRKSCAELETLFIELVRYTNLEQVSMLIRESLNPMERRSSMSRNLMNYSGSSVSAFLSCLTSVSWKSKIKHWGSSTFLFRWIAILRLPRFVATHGYWAFISWLFGFLLVRIFISY